MANKENIRKWVDALRSGEYEQGKGNLCRDSKYCCLGVACEVAIRDGLEIGRVEASEEGIVYYSSHDSFLPGKVMEWLGITGYNPVLGATVEKTATYLNDEDNLPFSQIADLIEAKYLNEQG